MAANSFGVYDDRRHKTSGAIKPAWADRHKVRTIGPEKLGFPNKRRGTCVHLRVTAQPR